MTMDKVRPELLQEVGQLLIDLTIPDRRFGQSQFTHRGNPAVVHSIDTHNLTMSLQDFPLSGKHLVFAAGLQVIVMDEKNFHSHLAKSRPDDDVSYVLQFARAA